MCLDLRRKSDVPYNRSRTRYKVFKVGRRGSIHGPYMGTRYKKTEWNVASARRTREMPNPEPFFGFHVFVNLYDAVKLAKWNGCSVAEVRCRGFLKSGTFEEFTPAYQIMESETWREVKIVKFLK